MLLAAVLLLMIASSYYLVTKLNTNLEKTQHSQETGMALKAAKNALVGYAIAFPEVDAESGTDTVDGPGYLPCPDISNNGSAGGSCSLINTNNPVTSIGRFPYKTIETKDFRDGHGERLWYVVSDNFRNNPKMIPLNSETAGSTSGDLTVNGYTNIAAVIFAVDAIEGSQDRSTANKNSYANYIEATFTDSDGDTYIDTITTGATDRYVLLTKDELMQMVEKRVLGQTSHMLSTYLNSQGAYPWLTPFSDPKADVRRLTGTANSGSDSTTLIDTSVNIDFVEWGVAVGDVVWNVTDGSVGFVSSVDSSTQLTITGMSLGTENDFDEDDAYQIQLSNVLTTFSGTATLGSTDLKLEDTTKDFDDLEIAEGDVLENVTDGSSGIIDSIDDDEITVTSLSGGTGNDIASGDSYRIRTNSGTVTANSTTILTDTKKDFVTIGITVGDVVHNVTDGSYGTITLVAATSLTVALEYGSENDFDIGDIYSISRFNPIATTREGHLAFHDRGEPFATALDIELYMPDSISGVANSTVAATNATTQPDYEDSIKSYVQGKTIVGTATGGSATTLVDTSRNFNDLGVAVGDVVDRVVATATDRAIGVVSSIDSNTQLTISTLSAGAFSNGDEYTITHTPIDNITDGVCVWATADIVECVGTSPPDTTFLSGTGMGSDNHELYDSSKDFPTAGVKRGDIVENTTIVNVGFDNSGIVESFNSNDDMQIENIEGYDHAHIDNGEPYKIHISTSSFSGTATSHTEDSGGVFTMTDTGGFPANVAVGDVIENTDASNGGGLGRIADITGNTITATKLSEGQDEVRTGQNYKIHSDHISERKYTYRLRFSGFSEAKTSGGEIRTRVVCTGYTDVSAINDCDGSAGETDLGLNYVVPGVFWVTMTDVDSSNVQLGQATLIPIAGADGFIKVADMDYYLREDDDEIPAWFIANNWHQLTYVAYSAGDSPGGGATCTVGTDCLTLSGGGAPDNNKRALVVSASSPLATQDRSSSLITDYFENENNDAGDDNAETGGIISTFNDQIRIIDTSP
jgi:hypothetical protein